MVADTFMFAKTSVLGLFFFLILGVFGEGCKKNSPPPSEPGSSQKEFFYEQPVDGNHRAPSVSFQILRVYDNHRPTNEAPFHQEGGDWTFLDCKIDSIEDIYFSVGFSKKTSNPGDDERFSFGKAYLPPSSPLYGERLVSLFAKSFSTKFPKKSTQPEPTQPLSLSTSVFGEKLSRTKEGGFSSKPGPWMASKWFLELEGYYAEVFFNVNLKEGKGEFSEKDIEYRQEMIQILAMVFRDGVPKDPTPETDARLTYQGPSIEGWERLQDAVIPIQFNPRLGTFFYLTKRSDSSSLAPDSSFELRALSFKTPKETVILTSTLTSLVSIDCAEKRLSLCLVRESSAQTPTSAHKTETSMSSGKANLFYILRKKQPGKEPTKEQIEGPWDPSKADLPSFALSPDGRYALVSEKKKSKEKPGNYQVLYLIRLDKKQIKTLSFHDQSLLPIKWVGSAADLHLIVQAGLPWDSGSHPYFTVDLPTGTLKMLHDTKLVAKPSYKLSFDGTMKAQLLEGKEVIITDRSHGKTGIFHFSPREQRLLGLEADNSCIDWITNKYVYVSCFSRPAFIHAKTLKMNYLDAPSQGQKRFLDPNTSRVFEARDDGLYTSALVDK